MSLAVSASLYAVASDASLVVVPISPPQTLGQYELEIGGNTLYMFIGEHQNGANPQYINLVGTDFGNFRAGVVGTQTNFTLPCVENPDNPCPVPPEVISLKAATPLAATDVINGSRTFVPNDSSFLPDTKGKGFVLLNLSETVGTKSGLPELDQFVDGAAYIGLRFDFSESSTPEYQYGCVEALSQNGQITLTQYAYETTVGADVSAGACVSGVVLPPPGTAPEPGTLALLVAGAVGVLALRRRQRAA